MPARQSDGCRLQLTRFAEKQAEPSIQLAGLLDVHGREGEGYRVLALLQSGIVKLPQAIRSQIAAGSNKGVGDAFRQLLDRLPLWQSLVAATPGLKPYSLRHPHPGSGGTDGPSPDNAPSLLRPMDR